MHQFRPTLSELTPLPSTPVCRALPNGPVTGQIPRGGQTSKSEQRRVPFGAWVVAILTIVLSGLPDIL